MKATSINRSIRRFLAMPPMQYEAAVSRLIKRLCPSDAGDLARAMESDAGRLAYLAEYISVRSGATGCGEHPHESAAKHARRRAIKVERALGYSYPERRVPNI